MTNQIRVTKPMQELIARFKMLTQTYERRVGYETVSCENVPDGEVICRGLHRACQYLESRLEGRYDGDQRPPEVTP